MLLALMIQAATPAPPDPPPAAEGRWSILAPVRPERCPDDKDVDVTVCGGGLPSQRLPYPDQVPATTPQPSNRFVTGSGALNAVDNEPCATRSRGCTVGFGPPIVPIAKWLIDKVGAATRKKPDKSRRVAIPLDDPVPAPAGSAPKPR